MFHEVVLWLFGLPIFWLFLFPITDSFIPTVIAVLLSLSVLLLSVLLLFRVAVVPCYC